MNTLIRLFDLDTESGHYNDYVYMYNGECHLVLPLRV